MWGGLLWEQGWLLVDDAYLGVVVEGGLQVGVALAVDGGGDEIPLEAVVDNFGDDAVGVEFDGVDDATEVVVHVHGDACVRVQFPKLVGGEVHLVGVFDVEVTGGGCGVGVHT